MSGAAFIYALLPWPEAARPSHALLAAIASLLLVVAWRRSNPSLISATLLVTLTSLACLVDPRWLPWPANFALPLAVHVLLIWRVPELRTGVPSLRRGELGGSVVWLALGVVVVSSSALVTWRWLARPELGDLDRMLPDVALPLLLLGGLGFALLNALLEEAVFRVVLFDALDDAGPTWAALLVQALAFGALHLHGFPRGVIGVGLAAIYGLMLGALRVRAHGMLAVYVAHVLADITIFAILLTWVR